MLRYKTETRPGLVALYDIRPGNGTGQFLQPRSLHGVSNYCIQCYSHVTKSANYSSAHVDTFYDIRTTLVAYL